MSVPCIHGEVCRAWMRKVDTVAPLTASCPACIHYAPRPTTREVVIIERREDHGVSRPSRR